MNRVAHPPSRRKSLRARLSAYRASKGGRGRRRLPPTAVPSFFTLMNLFSGFLAVTQIYEGRFDYACWLIILAAFFDVLDGMMARLTKGDSLFGVELDSLSDVVSFGLAPSFLVYAFGLKEFGVLGLIVSALPVICGAVRLARFNVSFDGEKRDYFVGLPIPGMAAAIVALILNFNDARLYNELSPSNLSLLLPIVFVLSGLMVSNIRFDAIPKPTPRYIRNHPKKAVAYFIGLLLIIFLQQIGVLITMTVYLAYSIGRALYNAVQLILQAPVDEPEARAQSGPSD